MNKINITIDGYEEDISGNADFDFDQKDLIKAVKIAQKMFDAIPPENEAESYSVFKHLAFVISEESDWLF